MVKAGDVSLTLVIAGRLVCELMVITICFLVHNPDCIEGFIVKKNLKRACWRLHGGVVLLIKIMQATKLVCCKSTLITNRFIYIIRKSYCSNLKHIAVVGDSCETCLS